MHTTVRCVVIQQSKTMLLAHTTVVHAPAACTGNYMHLTQSNIRSSKPGRMLHIMSTMITLAASQDLQQGAVGLGAKGVVGLGIARGMG